MTSLYRSPAIMVAYGDTPPDPQSPPTADPPSIEPPAAETPPVETPPPPTVGELLAKIALLEQRPTAEALAAREAELMQAIGESSTRLAELQTKHNTMIARAAISEAAVAEEAHSAAILQALLGPRATVEDDQVLIDVDGAKLPTREAVSRMRDAAEFAPLFRPRGVAGIGGHSGAEFSPRGMGGRVNLSSITSAEYRRLRRENPAALGLTRRPEVRR